MEDTDYADDFDLPAPAAAHGYPLTPFPTSAPTSAVLPRKSSGTTTSDPDSTTSGPATLFNCVPAAAPSDWIHKLTRTGCDQSADPASSTGYVDSDIGQGIIIMPPLRPSSPASSYNLKDSFDEQEDKQSTIKANAPQLTETPRTSLKDLSDLPDTMEGTMQLLGIKRERLSSADRQATADEVDLSFDMDLPDHLGKLPDPALRPKASFDSHFSIEENLDSLPASSHAVRTRPIGPSSSRKPRDSVTSLASQAESEHDSIEDDFDLPDSVQSLSLSSKNRGSQRKCSQFATKPLHSASEDDDKHFRDKRARTSSSASATSAKSGDLSSTSMLLKTVTAGGSSADSSSGAALLSSTSRSVTSTDNDDDDDDDNANFFNGIEASPLFPFAPRPQHLAPAKVDLQSLLTAKLEARSQQQEAASQDSEPASLPRSSNPRHRRSHYHREKGNDSFEDGLVLDDTHSIFRRVPSRGGSLDSAALTKQSLASRISHVRPSSFSSLRTDLGYGNSAPVVGAKRPSSRSTEQGFTRAVSDARAHAHQFGQSPQATLFAGVHPEPGSSKQTLRRKISTPLLSVRPAATAPPPSQSVSALSSETLARQRVLSLSRKASAPLLTAKPPAAQGRQPPRRLANEGRLSQLSSTEEPSSRPVTHSVSTAAARLTLPTLSSLAKQRYKSSASEQDYQHSLRSASDPTGFTSSVLFPSSAPRAGSRRHEASESTTVGSSSVLREPRRAQHYGDGTELDSFDDLPANKEKEKRLQILAKGRPDSATSGSMASLKKDPKSKGGRKTSQKYAEKVSAQGKRKGPRTQPQLIHNLNPTHVSKVQSGMVWNPATMKWEGNEAVLRAFEHVLTSSTRPALISPLPSHSPAFGKGRASKGLTAGLGGVRVVGDMVFDPVRMSWYHTNQQQEEELDFGDDEAESPIHQSMASTHSRHVAPSTPAVKDGFVEACREAEQRHHREMNVSPATEEERDNRAYLWKIREVPRPRFS